LPGPHSGVYSLCPRHLGPDLSYNSGGISIILRAQTGIILGALALALAAPGRGVAQIEAGFRLGIYAPAGAYVSEGDGYPGGRLEMQGVGAPLIGGQAVFWPRSWLGIEATGFLSPSMVALTDASGTADHTSTVMFASARALIPVTSRKALWSFYVGGGIGLVNRSGGVWDRFESGMTAPTAIVLFGGSTPLSETLRMRFQFEDNFSTAQFDAGLPTETQPHSHQDIMFAIAVEFHVGGRR